MIKHIVFWKINKDGTDSDRRATVEAFRKIDQTTDFPKMSRLLSDLQNYRGDGIAAKLFYESKVAEALSLVVEYQKKARRSPASYQPKIWSAFRR